MNKGGKRPLVVEEAFRAFKDERKQAARSSAFKGVTFDASRGLWLARVWYQLKNINLGEANVYVYMCGVHKL